MKELGIIAWAIVLTYLFCNDYFFWVWGIPIFIGLIIGIYRIIKQNKEKKEDERRIREREIMFQKRKFPSFNERLIELGFVETEEGNYENYINRNSVTISFLEGGKMLVEIYNDYKDEEFKKEYISPVAVMRKLCSLYN